MSKSIDFDISICPRIFQFKSKFKKQSSLVEPINNAMNDNDLKIILSASNDNLIRWVKRWKSIEPDTATFSAIVLEEAGEWDSIAQSIDDFCSEFNSNWESTKADFFEMHEVADFKELKHKIENNLLSSSNPIQEAGESLSDVAGFISVWLWLSIVTAIIVVVFTLNNSMGQKALLVIQIIYGLLSFYSITGVIRSLKRAGNLLKNNNN